MWLYLFSFFFTAKPHHLFKVSFVPSWLPRSPSSPIWIYLHLPTDSWLPACCVLWETFEFASSAQRALSLAICTASFLTNFRSLHRISSARPSLAPGIYNYSVSSPLPVRTHTHHCNINTFSLPSRLFVSFVLGLATLGPVLQGIWYLTRLFSLPLKFNWAFFPLIISQACCERWGQCSLLSSVSILGRGSNDWIALGNHNLSGMALLIANTYFFSSLSYISCLLSLSLTRM